MWAAENNTAPVGQQFGWKSEECVTIECVTFSGINPHTVFRWDKASLLNIS